jgi:hypothetical protein
LSIRDFGEAEICEKNFATYSKSASKPRRRHGSRGGFWNADEITTHVGIRTEI